MVGSCALSAGRNRSNGGGAAAGASTSTLGACTSTPPGALGLGHGVALDLQHRLVVQRGQLLDQRRVLDHDLRHALRVAQQQRS